MQNTYDRPGYPQERRSVFALRPATKHEPQQYFDDLIAESCKGAAVYGKGTLNDLFIEGVGAFIRHNLQNFWPRNTQTDQTNIAFQVK